MTDLLSIGTSATQLYRQALTTVSNNIANMNTEGYSRQEIVSVENSPSLQGVYYLGTGSTVESVTRAYDAFAEENLRNSTSELSFQQPTIQYANRIVDVMGSDTAGLSGAMDKFFAGANELTTNPSSTVLRTSFLAAADFLATRMSSIAGQLDAIGSEATADIDNGVKQINSITDQLAIINTKLQRKLTEASQPAALLDKRDLLLRELSGLVKIEVKIATSGAADVRLAGGGETSSLLKGQNASVLRVAHGTSVIDRSTITLELKGGQAKGQQYQLPGLQGGSVGGLLDLKNNLLHRAIEDLDHFALTLASEVNDVHRAGLDLNGNLGGDIFRVDPTVEIESQTGGSLGNLNVSVVNSEEAVSEQLTLTWDKQNNGFIVDDNAARTFFAANDVGEVDLHGVKLKNVGDLQDGEVLTLTVVDRPAKFMTMVIQNENEVAAASRLTVMASSANVSSALPQIEYSNSSPNASLVAPGVFDLSTANVRQFDATVSFSSSELWAQVPSGTTNFRVEIQPSETSSVQLQLVTANGVQLLGGSVSDPETLLSNEFFDSLAVYSDAALQNEAVASYRDLGIVYGYRAETALGATSTLTTMTTGSIPQQVNATGVDESIIGAGDLRLNGIALSELVLPANEELSALDVVAWLNQHSDETGVSAQATNLLKVNPSTLAYGSSLVLNNVVITGAESALNVDALVSVINGASAATNIDAYVDVDGKINLLNRPGHEGEGITLASTDVDGVNTLGLSSKLYSGQIILDSADGLQFDLVTSAGHGGKPADLAALGLSTGLYFSGTVPEDLAILVTGDEPGSTSVKAASGGVLNQSNSPRVMEAKFSISFSDDGTYSITEVESGSIVAKRIYDHLIGVQYGDITVRFDQAPEAGDEFVIEPAAAGSGNNGSIAALANLQQERVFVGGNTFSGGYIKILNDVGTKSFAATIANDALEVVYQQAVEKRDSKVGVSLDQEAASLIRFQQAFQAAAQVIQTSSKLFDTILSASN